MIIDPLTTADICANFKLLGPFVLVLLALVLPFSQKQLQKLETPFTKVARRKRLAVFLVGLLAFVGSALVSLLFYFPIPSAHDEFGYLLSADTFAHGRLTNPTHPMWIHFESFHILHQPTYNSKYFPGQGLILALGQVLGGHPIVGVWLSMSLACAAVCWMLQAWLPSRWAFLGGLLMILKLGLFSYWSQSYWGGCIPTIGGALIFGAVRRITRTPTVSNSLWLALGLSALVSSRPFEGLIISLPVLAFLFFWLLFSKKRPILKLTFQQVIVPMSLFLLVVGLFIGYYNFVVTGSVWILPYRAYESMYGKLPVFLWEQPPVEVSYNHAEMRYYYRGWFLTMYNLQTGSLTIYLKGCLEKLTSMWEFYLNWVFTIPLIVLPLLLKNRWILFALLSSLILILGMLLVVFSYGHFAAPGVCLLYYVVLQCMRRIYIWRWQNRPTGKLIVWSIPLYCILLIFLPITLREDPFFFVTPSPWEPPKTLESHWSFQRDALLSRLKAEEGKHLVVVSYLPKHNAHNEWVYNEADIDNAKVVWARNMKATQNCELIKYFHDRKIWFLQIDDSPNLLFAPYPIDTCP